MPSIILTGGGTAGHCIPHLAILPYLKEYFDHIYYIGSDYGIERQIIEKNNIPYFSIPCSKLIRKFTVKNLKIPYTTIKGIVEAKKILTEIKPDVVFSKGGYVALPVVIASKLNKLPVVAHESDLTLGLSNKISARFCNTLLTSFPETANGIKNGKYVGPPIRNNLKKKATPSRYAKFGFTGERPIILVVGGSSGAKIINDTVRLALDELTQSFDIIHICGKGNLQKDVNNNHYYQCEFLDEIEIAFAVSTICISRAGSNSLFELMSLQKPTLLIPLPKEISRGDQILNAQYFQKLGLANVLEQEKLTKDNLVNSVNNLYENKNAFIKNFKKHPITNSSETIAKILIDLAKNK